MKTAHVAPVKKQNVQEFVQLLREYPIVGIVDLERLPSPQLTQMRKQLRGDVLIRLTKKRLLRIAIAQVKGDKPGIEQLEQYLGGIPAVLFAKENPFKLYKSIQRSKSPAPAKAGQKAPRELMIPAGPTPFAPGPVISELGKVGIKAGIDQGKVVIKQDSIVAKEGQVISAELASILLRLGIEPMEIGLNLVAVYENGMIYEQKLLAVDEKAYVANVVQGHTWAMNLAVFAGYTSPDTIKVMIGKATRDSRAVATEFGIMADAVKDAIIGKAERQMLALKSTLNL